MNKDYTRTTITLPKPIFKALRKMVSKGDYSKYISEALKERLAREKSWKFSEAFGKLEVKKGSPLESTERFLARMEAEELEEIKELKKRK